jgi:hypothetical protein
LPPQMAPPIPVLKVDSGMHPLNNTIHSTSSHHKGVMLEDAVNVEALNHKTLLGIRLLLQ